MDNLGRNVLHTFISYQDRSARLMNALDLSQIPLELFNQKDKQGRTPVMLAAALRHFRDLRYFMTTPGISRRVDWNIKKEEEGCVLDIARARGASQDLLRQLTVLQGQTVDVSQSAALQGQTVDVSQSAALQGQTVDVSQSAALQEQIADVSQSGAPQEQTVEVSQSAALQGQTDMPSTMKEEDQHTDLYSDLASLADRLVESKFLVKVLEEDRRRAVHKQKEEEENLSSTIKVLEESLREKQRAEVEQMRNTHLAESLSEVRDKAVQQADLMELERRHKDEELNFFVDLSFDRETLVERSAMMVREIDQQLSEQRVHCLTLESQLQAHCTRKRKAEAEVEPEAVPECPVCLESLTPPLQIYQCKEGHLVCGDCRNKVTICTECRHHAGYQARNRHLEQAIARSNVHRK